MANHDEADDLKLAFSLHRSGKFDEAARAYRKIIAQNPRSVYALHSLGIIEAANGKLTEAAELMSRSLSIQPTSIKFIETYATVLCQLGDFAAALASSLNGLGIDKTNIYLLYISGASFLKLHRLQEALLQFDRILSQEPTNVAALNERATVLLEMKQYDAALASIEKAISLDPRSAEAHLNKGVLFGHLQRYDDAIAALQTAVTLKPELGNAWLGYGNCLFALHRNDEALLAYGRALSLHSDLDAVWLARGNVLLDLKRYEEALISYDRALALKPELAEAWLGRGNVFRELKRYEAAASAYDKALSIRPDVAAAWLGHGNVFLGLKCHEEALVAYDRALALRPDLHGAWLGRGNVFFAQRRYEDALACYVNALAIKPDVAEALLGRGHVRFEQRRYQEALASYADALTVKSDLAEAWLARGNAFRELRLYEQAIGAYDQALALRTDMAGAEGARLSAKMHICDWGGFEAACAHLLSSLDDAKVSSMPFEILAIPSSAEDQFRCAGAWVATTNPPSNSPLSQGSRYDHDRIRIGYVSSDFYEHATSYLMAGLFECHEKSGFETTAISLRPDDGSALRQRLETSFARFINVEANSDDEIAALIRTLEIDILIDLKGFTKDSRAGIFARRPAPIQVNFLGYPGTMNAEYIDYIIADRIVIPEHEYGFFGEKIVVLPNSYQPNDVKRSIADRVYTRSELGLPATGFVFCCFNNTYKITPAMFDCWMRILKQVDGAVLWLLEDNAIATSNLRKQAVARGVDEARLVFAKREPLALHLARHRLADLFLDTRPCNAHTTASDALWAGLPVLTCLGQTFAGRVAASLLNAIGLPELITTTPDAYERIAIELATRPEELAAIKCKLAANLLTTPLFDTALFTRHLEGAYTAMYQRHQAGLSPNHIAISA